MHTRVQTATDEAPLVQWQMHRLHSSAVVNIKALGHNGAEARPPTETWKCFKGIDWYREVKKENRWGLAELWVSFLCGF